MKKNNGELVVYYTFGTSQLYSDEGLTWQGSENREENKYILYGVINNPRIKQVIIKGDNYKEARIIDTEGDKRIWYFLQKDSFKQPIRIYGLSIDGE
ncbi:hypothetical protein BHF71_03985 [Vulcanibacillus modesticaldus]|uniref:Uncharacterized protein n=1 Tax=Vulcanibacillus modesticaldus TaxID=337097 RepID=A0A1D2YS69_9BACI|nr:hypothetical protein [Vulcanibacillus modesticaldus]OEF96896.1 hypothetical protein BHF71_03985 [Vulcanibacillus modesticaldus]